MKRYLAFKESLYWLGLVAPIAALGILFVTETWRQVRVASAIDQRVTRWQQDGLITNSVLALNDYESDHTRDESGRLRSVEQAAMRFGAWWNRDVRSVDKVAPPEVPWEAKPYVDYRIRQDQVLVDLAPDITDSVESTWRPSLFVSSDHYYQGRYWSSAFIEIKHRLFRKAYHSGDYGRALQLYEKIPDIALLRQSLEYPSWDAEQLSQLRSIVAKPYDAQKRWKNQLQGHMESAFMRYGLDGSLAIERRRQYFQDNGSLLGILPSHVWQVLEQYEAAMRLQPAGTLAHSKRAIAMQRDWTSGKADHSFSPLGFPFAIAQDAVNGLQFYPGNISQQITQAAFDRKWTIAAIAVRQYQIQEGKMPERITDLSRVGLTAEDWQLSPDYALHWDRENDGLRLSCIDVSDYFNLLSINRIEQLDPNHPYGRGWSSMELKKSVP
ncbi:hypothetical protein [Neorhodopirellula pilleata]|uniref:Uncharacterized protein n=1 Tax=Neorhodopirellula pilleata TaxID=2714738 RepID=A0A5C5ZLF6_9BACT|nr:hypothetical protein [Neorhodopirellula pilleata]TWT87807.1 hypothetical protein Pla100_59020 [Neorhodopirellula pilleata]